MNPTRRPSRGTRITLAALSLVCLGAGAIVTVIVRGDESSPFRNRSSSSQAIRDISRAISIASQERVHEVRTSTFPGVQRDPRGIDVDVDPAAHSSVTTTGIAEWITIGNVDYFTPEKDGDAVHRFVTRSMPRIKWIKVTRTENQRPSDALSLLGIPTSLLSTLSAHPELVTRQDGATFDVVALVDPKNATKRLGVFHIRLTGERLAELSFSGVSGGTSTTVFSRHGVALDIEPPPASVVIDYETAAALARRATR